MRPHRPQRGLLPVAWLMACLCAASAVQAQPTALPRELPPTEQAKAWIDQDPSVVEARRNADAALHGAAALAAGAHEWTARVATQRRSVAGVGTSNEWTAQVEHGVRIGGKAGLDRQLGDVDRAIAQARIGEARHEAARALAGLWLGWLAAVENQALAQEQLTFAEGNRTAVERRRRAGDASMLELSVADADLADVRRQASAADSLQAKARARLRVRFPQAAPVATPLGEATDLVWSEAQWRVRIVTEADPIKIAEGQQRKAELKAQRLRADRMADPVVGVYTASEAFRNERVFGISVSLPFGGSAREDRRLQALQEAEAARAGVERQRREIEAEVAETYADAVGHAQRGVMARRAATAAQETARLMQRAYTLGEADLQALLLARRQAVDAARAAAEARADALKAQHRLLVDAHLIWDLDQDD